ncbi:MAG TPA: DUF2807 domain-containing protein [Dermatophilaceae bacterium]|nr:DUF2807 domain-containing protein [Dermatophilaceae bacterium]
MTPRIAKSPTRTSRRRSLAALISAAVLALGAACTGDLPGGIVVGSGEVTSEVRQVPELSEVEVAGGIRLELVNGDTTSVVVTAQPNILSITRTQVEGSKLRVDTSRGYTSVEGVTVKLTTPGLAAISLSGGSSATGETGTVRSLALNASGGARMDLTGTVEVLDVEASGGAILDLGSLRAKTAAVELSGGVVATLNASSSLTGNASGGVVITLATRPGTVNVETSGGAVVKEP